MKTPRKTQATTTMRAPRRGLVALLGLLVVASAGAAASAGCDDGNAVKEPILPRDGGTGTGSDGAVTSGDGGPLADGAPSDCFPNPTTHLEIINACTDAVKIAKSPTLPLRYPDGGLPPLP